jgi:hypothetical protein
MTNLIDDPTHQSEVSVHKEALLAELTGRAPTPSYHVSSEPDVLKNQEVQAMASRMAVYVESPWPPPLLRDRHH